MANFWDLPKTVRERIYRLHLVQPYPIDFTEFVAACGGDTSRALSHYHMKKHRGIPKLLQVCKKSEREAAGIYFQENTFIWRDPSDSCLWKSYTWPRHLSLIRNVVVCNWFWFGTRHNEHFRMLKSLKSLKTLVVKVDERYTLKMRLECHKTIEWHHSLGLSPQLQLQTLHFCGVQGLLSLINIPQVEFASLTEAGSEHTDGSGAIPGGVLDTMVRREIMRPLRSRSYKRKGQFRFLELPAEIRNQIYSLLLVFPGVTYPKVDKPTSVTCQFPYLRGIERDAIPVPHSALAILETNRQIHNEAVGLFYGKNDLVFSYPAHFQDFAQSLERDRLRTVSSLTLFHKNHREGGLSTMATTLKLLRHMRGLKKFHLLIKHHLLGTGWSTPRIRRCVTDIDGVAILFTLRGISDIKVRDLDLDDRMDGITKRSTQKAGDTIIKELVEMLKHFNYGLTLAQDGIVVEELFVDTLWFKDEQWPALGASECGRTVGCLCEQPVGEEEGEKGAGSD